MSKIGIMTWYYGANYGALAQSIALYNTIKNFGYDCYLINYKPKRYMQTITRSNLPKIKEMYKLNQVIKGLMKIAELSKTDFFNVTSRLKNAESINSENFDCIVFGSDAIFNCEHPLCDPLFYGVGIKSKKITYSPSCEYLNPLYKLPIEYKNSLLEMDAISVRDKNTAELIYNNIGLIPQITLDPTFLYDFHDFDLKISSKRYLLFYSFSKWDIYADRIKEYAKLNNLIIICIGQSVKWADINIENASFEKWVSAFKNAECVMTDSFHGTVFSLKNNKPIILCGRKDKVSKISSLMDQINVNIDFYQGEKVEDYFNENNISYKDANESIQREIEKSLSYLINALK